MYIRFHHDLLSEDRFMSAVALASPSALVATSAALSGLGVAVAALTDMKVEARALAAMAARANAARRANVASNAGRPVLSLRAAARSEAAT